MAALCMLFTFHRHPVLPIQPVVLTFFFSLVPAMPFRSCGMTFDEKAGCVEAQMVVNKQGSYKHNEHEDAFLPPSAPMVCRFLKSLMWIRMSRGVELLVEAILHMHFLLLYVCIIGCNVCLY